MIVIYLANALPWGRKSCQIPPKNAQRNEVAWNGPFHQCHTFPIFSQKINFTAWFIMLSSVNIWAFIRLYCKLINYGNPKLQRNVCCQGATLAPWHTLIFISFHWGPIFLSLQWILMTLHGFTKFGMINSTMEGFFFVDLKIMKNYWSCVTWVKRSTDPDIYSVWF